MGYHEAEGVSIMEAIFLIVGILVSLSLVLGLCIAGSN